jgi:hypothetical protein
MLYQRRSFSVSSSTSKQNGPRGAMCAERGHSGTDSRGRCYCCGEKVEGLTSGGPAGETGEVAQNNGARTARTDLVPLPSQLAAITHDYLDEPAPHNDLELVKLEGGPVGDVLAPITSLHRLAHTTIYTLDFGTQVLWYRSIGVETDSPRVFAFDGFSRGP